MVHREGNDGRPPIPGAAWGIALSGGRRRPCPAGTQDKRCLEPRFFKGPSVEYGKMEYWKYWKIGWEPQKSEQTELSTVFSVVVCPILHPSIIPFIRISLFFSAESRVDFYSAVTMKPGSSGHDPQEIVG